MEFLKNHYEKLVLGVIVIGLVVAAVMVSMQAESAVEEEIGGSGYEAKASLSILPLISWRWSASPTRPN
jgi:hypothetical protein